MSPSITHVVITDNFAGVERYVTTVAAATAERGWDVRVVGGRADEMRDLLPTSVSWTPATTVHRAVTVLTQQPSGIVHAHMTNAEVAATLTPRRHRIVATRHFAAPRGRNRLVTLGTGLLARRLDAEIAISETVRRASGVPGMRVLLNPVPTSTGLRRPERTVVVAQRWEREKRTCDAIAAFERSRLPGCGWTLVLHGAGAEDNALRRLAAASNYADSIEVSGYTKDMPHVLSRAGIVLATAENEPFGLVVAEAMAAGAPVVASGSGGHLETVGEVGAARLFPPGDVDACAEQLNAVADLPVDVREQYGACLRRWTVEHLDVESHVDGLLAAYTDAVR